MSTKSSVWLGSAALLILSAVIPVALASLLIMLDHWAIIDASKIAELLPWQLIVTVTILPGLIPISRLRLAIEWRLASGMVYFLAMFAVMPLYGLVFSCAFTGDCI